MAESVFYQLSSADPDTGNYTRAEGTPPYDVTGLPVSEHRFIAPDGTVHLVTPQGAPILAAYPGTPYQFDADIGVQTIPAPVNSGGTVATWSLVLNSNAAISINSTTGVVSVDTNSGAFAPETITTQATNAAGSDTTTASIAVGDVEPPDPNLSNILTYTNPTTVAPFLQSQDPYPDMTVPGNVLRVAHNGAVARYGYVPVTTEAKKVYFYRIKTVASSTGTFNNSLHVGSTAPTSTGVPANIYSQPSSEFQIANELELMFFARTAETYFAAAQGNAENDYFEYNEVYVDEVLNANAVYNGDFAIDQPAGFPWIGVGAAINPSISGGELILNHIAAGTRYLRCPLIAVEEGDTYRIQATISTAHVSITPTVSACSEKGYSTVIAEDTIAAGTTGTVDFNFTATTNILALRFGFGTGATGETRWSNVSVTRVP